MIGICIVLLSITVFIPKFQGYQQKQEEQKLNEQREKERKEEAVKELDEVRSLYEGDFTEQVKNEKLDISQNPTSTATLNLLSGKDKKEYEEIEKGFSKISKLYKEMININKEIKTFEIINNASTKNDDSRNMFNEKKTKLNEEIAKLPKNQQGLFNLMMEDMQTEFNFYDSMRKNYFEPEYLFLVSEDNPYMAFGEALPKILEDTKQIKPVSPIGFRYFGLGAIESDINTTIMEQKLDSARYYNEIESDKREDMISAHWENNGGRYGLYLTNTSDEYIKFAEEAFLIYNDFTYIYLHTSQFEDTRSGLDELNRVNYGERSRSGYTWTTFTLAPDETKKIGSVSSERFEKISYDGVLRYRYNDKQSSMGGVPEMRN